MSRHGAATFLLAAVLAAGGLAAPAMAASPPAQAGALCAGHPRVALKLPAGWCAARVADASDGLRMPRRLLEISPGRFWLLDMGSWEPRRGRLLALDLTGATRGPARVSPLATGLDRPHGLARGPDGRIYIGEAGVVWRTPPGPAVQRENLITGLPDDGAHPLKELAFGDGGRLYVNVGSFSDACRDAQQRQPLPCPEASGTQPRAAVYEARLGGAGFTLQSFKPYATGLRNSLGLVVLPHPAGPSAASPASTSASTLAKTPSTPSAGTPAAPAPAAAAGVVWQAENSVDYADASLPAEELNRLQPGSRHGWPECVTDARGRAMVARGYEGRARCPASVAPAMAWPAHVAPLQLLQVPAAAAGQPVRPWSGRLLAVWHGYRPGGHRIVAWRLGPDGQPTGPREDLVSGWDAVPGQRPVGAPAGVTVDHQGRLWVVDDRNRQLLLIAPDTAP